MIFLLVRNSCGYDDPDCPLFAHHDVGVVGQVRDRLQQHYEKAREIARQWLHDENKVRESTFPLSPCTFFQKLGELKQEYIERQVPEAILNSAHHYHYNHTFSIQTIEDDPNVDVSSL